MKVAQVDSADSHKLVKELKLDTYEMKGSKQTLKY